MVAMATVYTGEKGGVLPAVNGIEDTGMTITGIGHGGLGLVQGQEGLGPEVLREIPITQIMSFITWMDTGMIEITVTDVIKMTIPLHGHLKGREHGRERATEVGDVPDDADSIEQGPVAAHLREAVRVVNVPRVWRMTKKAT